MASPRNRSGPTMSYQESAGMEVESYIDAPREDVFDLIGDTANWQELFTCITDGRVLTDHSTGEDVKLEWEVTVMGISVDVREKIDEYDPPKRFTWTSIEGSKWNHEGAVTFTEVDSDRTRVHTYMDYDFPRVVDNRITRRLFKRRFQSEIARSFERASEMLAGND